MKKKLTYTPELDFLKPEEMKLLDELTLTIREFVKRSPGISRVPYKTRDVHATTYAVLKGTFRVHEALEEAAVFPSKKMEAVLRISNAHMKIVNGKTIPAYGFSLKLLHEGQTTANFPLVNFPLFPFHNVKRFLKLFTGLNRFLYGDFRVKVRSAIPIFTGIISVLPQIMHLSFLKNLWLFIKRKNDFILSWPYHSIGVYRMGNHLVKIKLVPAPAAVNARHHPHLTVEDYMDENGKFTAQLFVQYAYNPEDQPVNELHREWHNSPFVPAGTLMFASVLCKNDPQHELLSFNPFENTEDLKPVGKIQQLRKKAYEASYNARSGML